MRQEEKEDMKNYWLECIEIENRMVESFVREHGIGTCHLLRISEFKGFISFRDKFTGEIFGMTFDPNNFQEVNAIRAIRELLIP